MIEFIKGDIWETDCNAIVIPTNCGGVAGAGLAEQAKNKSSIWFEEYSKVCNELDLKSGMLFTSRSNFEITSRNIYLINAFTKDYWSQNSKYSSVAACIVELGRLNPKIKSIAVPALGCGFGNLKWSIVRNFMVEQFTDSPIHFFVYESLEEPN